MNQLPPSILVDDHGTIKDAFLVEVRDGVTTYRVRTLQEQREWITELLKPEPSVNLSAQMMRETPPPSPRDRFVDDTERAMVLIGKAFEP